MAFESIQTELFRLKREEPFREFDIVTREGDAVHVGGRFRFGFNGKYVLVGDEHDRVTRVRFENISRIAESGEVSQPHA